MSINYNFLLEYYNCQFEGVDKLIFYYDLYPTSFIFDEMTSELWGKYNFSQGLKYISEESKDISKDKNQQNEERYKKNQQKYIEVLSNFIRSIDFNDSKNKIGIITIPSSKKDVVNQVTKITQETIKTLNYSNIVDLTEKFIRVESKERAHDTGHRDISSNIETLSFSEDVDLNKYDAILVIDDVVTSGNSFLATNKIIEDKKYEGDILNFAFSRSMNHQAILYFEKNLNVISKKEDQLISGIIFDFDQTLINTSYREQRFESNFRSVDTNKMNDHSNFLYTHRNTYNAYEGVEKLQRKRIPFTILTNSYIKRIQILLQLDSILKSVYPDTYDSMNMEPTDEQKRINEKYLTSPGYRSYDGYLFRYSKFKPKNVFSSPKEKNGEDNYITYQKPNPKGAKKAKKWLVDNFDLCENDRIIGVGNTIEDMITYNELGIESVLALWGVPIELKEFARKNWPACYIFDDFEQLDSFIETTGFNTF